MCGTTHIWVVRRQTVNIEDPGGGILPDTIILAHLEKCGFSAQRASCGRTKNALMAVGTVFA